MLVVVNQPLTNNHFEIRGVISSDYLKSLYRDFGDNIEVKDTGDNLVDAQTMDWYKELDSFCTPSENIKFYRKLENIKQVDLAKMLGVSRQYLYGMESGARGISKEMAKKLAKVLNVSPAKFL